MTSPFAPSSDVRSMRVCVKKKITSCSHDATCDAMMDACLNESVKCENLQEEEVMCLEREKAISNVSASLQVSHIN